MPMTQLECWRATVAHRPHDGFLFYADFTPDLDARVRADQGVDAETDLHEHFGMFNPKPVVPKPPPGYTKPDYWQYYGDIDMPEGATIDGNGVLGLPGSLYHFLKLISPLRNAESFAALEAYPYPSVTGFDTDHMAAEVQAIHDAGRVAASEVVHMYEDAWEIRGGEQFLIDMAINREWVEYILDRITERNMDIATACARAGVDYLATADDVANQVGMMFSVDDWRHFMKPRWTKVFAAARAIKPDIEIWYHSDGNIEEIIPELIEIGVTILNPVQPECIDPLEVHRKYRDKLTLDGTIGTQTTMPFGSTDDVRTAATIMMEAAGPAGGLIISPTHVLEPEVPLENIYALIDAVTQFTSI